MQSKGQYINGQWIPGKGQELLSVNPADATVIWEGHIATETELHEAGDFAHQALETWAIADFTLRAKVIQAFAKQVETKREFLAKLISQETGKPLWEAQTEITAVLGKVQLALQAYQERTWPHYKYNLEVKMALQFKPQGVVAVLGAFNFPAHLSHGHIIPALLAGNTVLYKPSELTPAVNEALMDCWDQTALPKGVLQCLQGDKQTAKTLLTLDLQGVFFTGSYATGLAIHQAFVNKPEVILALEMGGNNPLIIDDIDEIQTTIYHTLLSTLLTSGQRCSCARRLILPQTQVADEFLDRLINAFKNIQIGAYDKQPEPFMGPVISASHALTHLNAQAKRIEAGAKALLPMTLLQEQTGFLSPGILEMSDVKNHIDEEIFAPLIQVYRYQDFDEAIVLANQTRYGLTAGLFSQNEAHYREFYQKIRAGIIYWNRPTTGASSALPFGGVGSSGNHRPSAYFAADYCAYPVASMEATRLQPPDTSLPGIDYERL